MRRIPWVPRLVLATVAAVAAVALAGCATLGATRVGDIVEHPGRYDGRVVTVAGESEGGLNLLVVKGFRLRDGSGSIHVITTRPLPRKGERVRVRGRVDEAFKIGDASVVVLVEENERR